MKANKQQNNKKQQQQIVVRRAGGQAKGSVSRSSSLYTAPGPSRLFAPKDRIPRSDSVLARTIAERTSGLRAAGSYVNMVFDPFNHDGERYPDETLAPTGIVKMLKSITYTVPSGASTVQTWLQSKVVGDGTTPNGCILNPIAFQGDVSGQLIDYGSKQWAWLKLDAQDRTVAAALRVRRLGLPTGQYMPSGKMYCLQLAPTELRNFTTGSYTETDLQDMITAKKGYCVSLGEVPDSGMQVPLLPVGPNSFTFSDANNYLAADAGTGIGGNVTSEIISAGPTLAIVMTGLTPGQVFEFGYCSIVEYLPTVQASGIVSVRTQPPSSTARDSIASALSRIGEALFGKTSIVDLPGNFGPMSAFTRTAVKMAGDFVAGTAAGYAGRAAGAGVMALL